jgi:8-amino-3,8-dideoxy-alpha-D-manno-octulosonate transaminase
MPGYEVFGEEERRAVLSVFDESGGVLFAHGFDGLRNGRYFVRDWERAFASRFGFGHAQAVSSGSAAVRVALESAGVGPGDEVITQAHTFIATVEAILQLGAVPVVVDVDDTLNMDPVAFEEAVSSRTRAVVPVHMMGEMADMDPIMKVAREHEIIVVEDAAQGLGASYRGQWAGSFGLTAAFSTDAGKTLNTGEGGMVVTSDVECFESARAIHDHGHAYLPGVPRGKDPALRSGFNYRMTELQAAIGLAQLSKLDLIVGSQRSNKAALVEQLQDLPITFRRSVDPSGDLGDTLVMILPTPTTAQAMVDDLQKQGIGTKNLPDAMRWHFAGAWSHLPGLRDPRSQARAWSKSDHLLHSAVALAVTVRMTHDQIFDVASAVRESVLRHQVLIGT